VFGSSEVPISVHESFGARRDCLDVGGVFVCGSSGGRREMVHWSDNKSDKPNTMHGISKSNISFLFHLCTYFVVNLTGNTQSYCHVQSVSFITH
jgi:hypothetical protein